MNIVIIGTSHIAAQSVEEIKDAVKKEKPDIIAVELDKERARALLSGQQSRVSLAHILQIGVKGYAFAKIGQYVQQKLGKMVGVKPGSDMKTAIEVARAKKLRLALIDQPIGITLKRFSGGISWRERFRFVGDIFRGIFSQKKQMKLLGLENFDLTKVPAQKVIEKLIGQLEQRYPGAYRVLISERNSYMVRKLVGLLRKYPGQKILVVVGAGHKKGMGELLLKVDVV